MSRFWKYFHDSLNWPAIFSPGPVSAVVKGLALYMDDVREDILWLRRQWSPATADDEQVAKYGESRGIQRTRFDTDESYRLRVVNAYAWHKLGGKVRGVEKILQENGFSSARIQSSGDLALWAHFRVKLETAGLVLDPETLSFLFWLLNEYKPGRSILSAVLSHLRLPLERQVAIGYRHRTTVFSRLYFKPPELVEQQSRVALAICGTVRTGFMLCFPSPHPTFLRPSTFLGLTGITSTRVSLAHAVSE